MQQHSLDFRLVKSERMIGATEGDKIRLARLARDTLNLEGKRVEIRVGNKSLVLTVRKAFAEDVVNLKAKLQAGKISEEQVRLTGFISSHNYSILFGRADHLSGASYITETVDSLMLGADPEFCLVDDTGNSVYAADIQGLSKTTPLGHDGTLAEIRPTPAVLVDDLVENISKLLKGPGAKPIAKYNWVSGATFSDKTGGRKNLPIGGHIHVGKPALLPPEVEKLCYGRIIDILDENVALPLCRLDRPNPAARREKYGKAGDQRDQTDRFEWRVLSGFWLAHPELSRIVLATTKAVSENCYRQIAEKKWNADWIKNPSGLGRHNKAFTKEIVSSIINSSKASAVDAEILDPIANRLKAMSTYHAYKDDIDEFIRITRLGQKDMEKISLNLKENWLEGSPLIGKGA